MGWRVEGSGGSVSGELCAVVALLECGEEIGDEIRSGGSYCNGYV